MNMRELNLPIKNTAANLRPIRLLTGVLGAMVMVAMVAGCAPGEKEAAANKANPGNVAKSADAAGESTSSASGTLSLSPQNTAIGFLGEKLVGSHQGKFTDFSGSVSFREGDPLTADINVKIDMSSVKTDEEKLDGHLKSPDFFDVARYPDGTFVSTAVTAGGKGDVTHTVQGNLTLHGVSRPVTIPARIEVGEKTVSVKAEFSINRQDFGISYPGMPDNLIKDDVKISLQINGDI